MDKMILIKLNNFMKKNVFKVFKIVIPIVLLLIAIKYIGVLLFTLIQILSQFQI